MGVSDEAIIPATDEKGSFFKLGLTIKNTGKTPALNLSAKSITTTAVRGDTPPTWEEIENNLHASYQPSGTSETLKEYVGPVVGYITSLNKLQCSNLAPGAPQTWDYEIFRREGGEKSTRLREYLLVRIIYTDVFSKNEHITKMCFMETIQNTAEHCATGNSMD